MGKVWSYNNFKIEEGLKPGAEHFQYFFLVSEGAEKKCNYCVWIEEDGLSRFSDSRDFDAIVSSQRDLWKQWVRGKIDEKDFRDRVLKFKRTGEEEVDLSQMTEHMTMD